jgi:hypothetical protein
LLAMTQTIFLFEHVLAIRISQDHLLDCGCLNMLRAINSTLNHGAHLQSIWRVKKAQRFPQEEREKEKIYDGFG